MHEPMSPALSSSFHPFFFTKAPNCDNGVARSGVNGPLIVGSSFDKSYIKSQCEKVGV